MTNNTPHASTEPEAEPRTGRISGVGRVLVVIYGILALAATGRSLSQIITRFDEAPLAFSLSLLAAVVYVVATVALIRRSVAWYRVAWGTIVFEFIGVLVVGTISVVDGALFSHDTVWSFYGRGYLFVPLVLPVLGMWWLARHRPVADAGTAGAGTGAAA